MREKIELFSGRNSKEFVVAAPQNGYGKITMDFPVAPIDIENFSKSVAFETPERDGEPVRPPRGSVDMAMDSSSSDDGRTIATK